MSIKEKIKNAVHEMFHPSFESLMHEFAIVEDRTMGEEERMEYARMIQEELMWEEAYERAKEERKRKRKAARSGSKHTR